MPPCTVHLLSFSANNLQDVLQYLAGLAPSEKPLVISRPVRWIILPEFLTTASLLTPSVPYDLLLVLRNTAPLPAPIARHVVQSFTLTIGVPSALLKDWEAKNRQHLHPDADNIPALTGALEQPRITQSAQGLELTEELRKFAQQYDSLGPKWAGRGPGAGAISMLNLLSFVPDMHDEYQKYGKAFAESIGSRRGGNAKVVGRVLPDVKLSPDQGRIGKDGNVEKGWDEVALAHYPSIWHFIDMLASEDYQAVNHKHRLHSLRDTCILMTSELEAEKMMADALRYASSSRL